jgi:antitoxin FitA
MDQTTRPTQKGAVQLLIRGLDPAVKARLRSRAMRNGSSMEAEARVILTAALALQANTEAVGFGTAMLQCFSGSGAGLTTELATLPRRLALPAAF